MNVYIDLNDSKNFRSLLLRRRADWFLPWQVYPFLKYGAKSSKNIDAVFMGTEHPISVY